MRADRLLSILLLLQNRGKLTTSQLSEMLEISEERCTGIWRLYRRRAYPYLRSEGVREAGASLKDTGPGLRA
ncbi:hypothetical protein [Paenibacillus apii]|uniref:hypothetical protein n=1 Tax=Paenibacillus apii TaxID=1850370 RepID=UPI001F19D871|nr:hypothetical protein [Paenibacillus apii]